jgi:uncharacterized membrane protein
VSTKAPTPKRLEFVDALRGLAVVFMVPLHTSHGWLRLDARHGSVWTASQFFGGLAAPIFLTLAGVSLGLQWANSHARGRRPHSAKDLSRALQLVVLGYLLRLQMWLIDGGGYARPSMYLSQALLLTAYGLVYYGLGLLPTRPRRAAWLSLGALVPFTLGLHLCAQVAPDRAKSLLRVDVLQCIGGSLAVLSGVAVLRRDRFADKAFYIVAGLAIALLTGAVRAFMPGPIPEALAGYLGQWVAPAGQPVIGLFPLFPWASYAFVGVGLGLSWGREPDPVRVEAWVVGLIALGAGTALVSSEAWLPVYKLLGAHAWLTQPVRVTYRIGLVLTLLGAALAARPRSTNTGAAPLVVMGRASLPIYWVHLEFAFGALAHPLSRRLDLRGWALGSCALLGAMWLLAYVRLSWPRLRFHIRNIAMNS